MMVQTVDTTYQGMREAEVEALRRALALAAETLELIEIRILGQELRELEADLPAIQRTLHSLGKERNANTPTLPTV